MNLYRIPKGYLFIFQLFKVVADILFDANHAEGLEFGLAEDLQALVVIHFDLDSARQEAALDNDTSALGGIDNGVDFGEGCIFALIGIVLEAQAAHQSAAGTADFRRRKRKVLLLCHFNRNLCEVGQEGITAERSAAGAETAEKLCLVADADLAELDSGSEYTCQILDKLAEVNSSVGGEIEAELGVVVGIFHIDKLHIKSVLFDLFLPNGLCILLELAVFGVALVVLLGRLANNRLQGENDLGLADLFISKRDFAIFNTANRFDNCVLALLEFDIKRRKIINLASGAEFDSDNLDILDFFLFLYDVLRLIIEHIFSFGLGLGNKSASEIGLLSLLLGSDFFLLGLRHSLGILVLYLLFPLFILRLLEVLTVSSAMAVVALMVVIRLVAVTAVFALICITFVIFHCFLYSYLVAAFRRSIDSFDAVTVTFELFSSDAMQDIATSPIRASARFDAFSRSDIS